jgi:threonine/homoserine/homoserine lactone efflux protein
VTTIQALAFASFTFANSITPGPNNTMLLASGANYGFARTVPHIAGITAGCIVMLLLVGFGLGQFFAAFPVIYDVLRDVGAAYLLWLAWKIARASPPSADRAEGRPMTFLQAAVFQWVNPKAWVIVISAVTAYTNHAGFGNDVITLAVILSLVMTPSIGAWAGCGTVLKAILLHPGRIRTFNMAMALLLVLSLLPMFAM